MPRGAKPGERRGGRAVGKRNKATEAALARQQVAEQVAEQLSIPGSAAALAIKRIMAPHKLAKEELEETLPVIKGVLGFLESQAFKVPEGGGSAELVPEKLDTLREWLKLFVDAAHKLADFQSPKFKAIMVQAAPLPIPGDNARTVGSSNVVNMADQTAVARVYREIMQGPIPKRAPAASTKAK